MSSPISTSQSLPPLDPEIGLMFVAADHLIPLFQTGSIDTSLARQMAISAIDAYYPQSRADYVNVARTIAFSMAALALLGQAAAQDITMREKMRVLGRATALNRSADQSERTMMQRRRYHDANPPAEQPEPAAQTPPPNTHGGDTQIPDTANEEAEMNAAIANAMREYLAACKLGPNETKTAAAAAMEEPTVAAEQPPANTCLQPPATVQVSAINHPIPRLDASQPPQTMSFKQKLLHQSAMQPVAGTGTASNFG